MKKKLFFWIFLFFLIGILVWIVFLFHSPEATVMDFKSFRMTDQQIPVVYSDRYNISFGGLEFFHPFDSRKYGRTIADLVKSGVLKEGQWIEPGIPSDSDLLLAHSQWYLDTLAYSSVIAEFTEMPVLRFFPSSLIRSRILFPMLHATGGSVLAGWLAMRKGWAINLGGGFHHASSTQGGGFCIYADISLMIRYLRHHHPMAKKFMIIDLDAHQGNGYAKDFFSDSEVFIVDVYNPAIYPQDTLAKKAIAIRVEMDPSTDTEKYLKQLAFHLNEAFEQFQPDMIIYNAGTDILEGDPLGKMQISAAGIVQRDELVFRYALMNGYPIVMLLSGGYQKNNYAVISRSIANLKEKFQLF